MKLLHALKTPKSQYPETTGLICVLLVLALINLHMQAQAMAGLTDYHKALFFILFIGVMAVLNLVTDWLSNLLLPKLIDDKRKDSIEALSYRARLVLVGMVIMWVFYQIKFMLN